MAAPMCEHACARISLENRNYKYRPTNGHFGGAWLLSMGCNHNDQEHDSNGQQDDANHQKGPVLLLRGWHQYVDTSGLLYVSALFFRFLYLGFLSDGLLYLGFLGFGLLGFGNLDDRTLDHRTLYDL